MEASCDPEHKIFEGSVGQNHDADKHDRKINYCGAKPRDKNCNRSKECFAEVTGLSEAEETSKNGGCLQAGERARRAPI